MQIIIDNKCLFLSTLIPRKHRLEIESPYLFFTRTCLSLDDNVHCVNLFIELNA